ncbi:MAG: hypothetical protein ACO1SV_03435 [Fimbriimonas sp.]
MPAAIAALVLMSSTPVSARERFAVVGKEYGVEVVIVDRRLEEKRNGFSITAEPVSEAILERYAPIFEQEWRRYPRSLMVRTRVGKIVIGTDVRVLGQPRAAVPDFSPGWYWLDAQVGQRIPRYGKHVLHHDFFHMIDERDSEDGRRDALWEALNPSTVKYGKGGWFMQSGNVGALREDLPGFLTEYATSAVEEDKAEVYGHLLGSPAFVRRRAAADPVLAAKVARIKALVKAFEPAMDDAWWVRNTVE